MFYTKKQREELLASINLGQEEAEVRLKDFKKDVAKDLKEHTELIQKTNENIDRVRLATNTLVGETEENLTNRIRDVEGNLEVMINAQTQAVDEKLNEKINKANSETNERINALSDDLVHSNEQLQDKIGAEISNLEDRLITKITTMLGNTTLDLQEVMAKKIKQLELFKEGEELLGDNAIGFAVIQEMVKRAFRKEYEVIETQTKEIEDQKRKLKTEELKLKQLKFVGSITTEEFTKALELVNEEYLENSRRSTSTNDTHDIKAQCAKHTIDFLTKWKQEKN